MAVDPGIAVNQAVHAHEHARSAGQIFQAVDPVAVLVGLLDTPVKV
jgi:hypothetical protein